MIQNDMMIPTDMRTLVQAEPTTEIDIKIGVAVYHTTVNNICDLFLNLMPALTQGDLKRLHDVGLVARRELQAQTSTRLHRAASDASSASDADPAKSNTPVFGQRQTRRTTPPTPAQTPHLGVIASDSTQRRKKNKARAQT